MPVLTVFLPQFKHNNIIYKHIKPPALLNLCRLAAHNATGQKDYNTSSLAMLKTLAVGAFM